MPGKGVAYHTRKPLTPRQQKMCDLRRQNMTFVEIARALGAKNASEIASTLNMCAVKLGPNHGLDL
jgi:transcriptional regulator